MSRQELLSAQTSLAKHYGDPAKGNAITRHIMLCAVSDKQKCCPREAGEEAWGFLKSRLKELGLVGPDQAVLAQPAQQLAPRQAALGSGRRPGLGARAAHPLTLRPARPGAKPEYAGSGRGSRAIGLDTGQAGTAR